jgi:hypothetical protein
MARYASTYRTYQTLLLPEILNALQEKIGKHPEIGAAITKLEMALNVLTIKTGALL